MSRLQTALERINVLRVACSERLNRHGICDTRYYTISIGQASSWVVLMQNSVALPICTQLLRTVSKRAGEVVSNETRISNGSYCPNTKRLCLKTPFRVGVLVLFLSPINRHCNWKIFRGDAQPLLMTILSLKFLPWPDPWPIMATYHGTNKNLKLSQISPSDHHPVCPLHPLRCASPIPSLALLCFRCFRYFCVLPPSHRSRCR